MNIQIVGRDFLDRVLSDGTAYNVVYITEPGKEVKDCVALYSKEYLPMWFYDVVFPIGNKYTPPTKEQIEEILNLTSSREEPFIVSCAAGISRSSATAYLITYQKTGSIDEALNILSPNRHSPNILIAKHGSEIFNNPEVYTRLINWLQVNGLHHENSAL